MTNPDYKAMCAELVDIATAHCNPDDDSVGYCAAVLDRARAALDEPETSPITSDSTMTIEEIQAAKLKLESTISKLLSQFSSETGTVVSNVDIERLMRHGAPTLYVVQLDVKL